MNIGKGLMLVDTLIEIEQQFPKIKINRAENLTGQKFGRLTALYRTNQPENVQNPNGNAYWLCQCDCGQYTVSSAPCLKRGFVKSCGCQNKESAMKKLLGKRFGKLTVIEEEVGTCSRGIIRRCQCDCGNTVDVVGTLLIQHKVLSCGCLGKSKGEYKISQILTENNVKFEKEKTFDTCRFPDTNALARFDFYLPEYNILIEYDGEQHFNNKGWITKDSFKHIQEHDKIKDLWCKENKIILIRIPYTMYEQLDWNFLYECLLNDSKSLV